jgi:hypothetical protein
VRCVEPLSIVMTRMSFGGSSIRNPMTKLPTADPACLRRYGREKWRLVFQEALDLGWRSCPDIARPGLWRTRFNSDSYDYGPDFANHVTADVGEEAYHGMPCWGKIGIGPYTVVIFSQDR